MPTVLFRSDVRRIVNHLPDDSFGLQGSIVGDAQGSVIRQPNIQIKPILDIFGKELGLKSRTEQPASDQENQGPGEDSPSVFYGFADESVVEAVKSLFPSLFDGRFSFCWSTQNVVAQERNKRHRNNVSAQQGSRHHHREALQE